MGDVVRGPMLAHKGKEEGVMVADLIAGLVSEVNYKVIPSVIYTAPEIAWVGLTEEEVKKSGRPYKVGSFPFMANGRARALESSAGFAKIVSAVDDDEILGVHVLGAMAGELIAEAVLAMEYSASTEDLQRTIHAHPTLSEALHEAALARRQARDRLPEPLGTLRRSFKSATAHRRSLDREGIFRTVENRDVFHGAPRDGFTAFRKIPSRSRLRPRPDSIVHE